MMVNGRTPFDRRSLRCRKLFSRCPRPNFQPTLPMQKPRLPTARKTVLCHGPIEHVATSGYPTRGIAAVSEARFGEGFRYALTIPSAPARTSLRMGTRSRAARQAR
jgi:hypothetical protein